MHFHFVFSAPEILWTLTFAEDLVLLVVLLGRDRARRFPWFTASIVIMALLLLTSKLLFNRIPEEKASIIFIAVSDLAAIVGLLVVVELARRAFAGASAKAWTIATALMLAIAGTVLVLWGPWPAWSTFSGGSTLVILRGMQMFADKGTVLCSFLDIELAIAIVLLGRRFHGGWRSYPQQIVIGLSTAAISQLVVRTVWQLIATHTVVKSHAQFDRFMALRERMYHANNVIYLCVVVWWIAWLWLDEPGTPAPGLIEPETHLATSESVESQETHELNNLQA